MENFQEKFTGNTKRSIEKPSIPVFKTKEKKIDLPTVASLDDDHFAKKYLIGRKIPTKAFNDLYFAPDFKAFVESVSDKQLEQTGPRVIIPFYNRAGDLIAFQGRALGKEQPKYITIKIGRAHV